jgi:hypothetical protein
MDIETRIRRALKEETERMDDEAELKEKVMGAIPFKRERSIMKKRLLAGIVAAAIMVPTAGFAGYSYLADRIFGSQSDFVSQGGSGADYMRLEEKLAQAKKVLSDKEYTEMEALLKEVAQYHAKMSGPDGKLNVNRLTEAERQQYNQLEKRLDPYAAKLEKKQKNSVKILTLEESQKLLSFPVRTPAYVPEGYVLSSAVGALNADSKQAKPVINIYYEKGGEGLGILLREVSAGERPGVSDEYASVKEYNLQGYDAILGQDKNGKGSVLSLNVPAQGDKGAYHIYVSGPLSQSEIEKVALSIVRK